MVFAALAVLAPLQATSIVADYFPLKPGEEWTYEERSGTRGQVVVDAVGSPVLINDVESYPISTSMNGGMAGQAFHRISGDSVLIVCFENIKRPLPSPYPILKCDSTGNGDWQYAGTTDFLGAPASMTMKGTCRKGKEMDVLGTKRETLEVKLITTINPPELPEASIRSESVSIYAKGVGLVSVKETSTVGKGRKEERTRTLIKYKSRG